jgi:hypothetical protein
MPLFRCGFFTPKAGIVFSISIRQERNSSRLPAEFGAGNIQDSFARKRNYCRINLVKYTVCCVFFHILFYLHDGWALYLFRLQGLKHRPIYSSTFLASYYSDKRTVATGFSVQAFLRDVNVIYVTALLLCPHTFALSSPLPFSLSLQSYIQNPARVLRNCSCLFSVRVIVLS